jgi:hypothetical protein
MQHRRDPTIAISAILGGKFDDVSGQSHFIFADLGSLALGGSMLTENTAGSPLRDAKLLNHTVHTSTAASGAQ